jgi:hypothetical protein
MTSFERRLVDNTLPQSAAHFVRHRGGEMLDPAAPAAFAAFVDAFVNSPVRCATLPGADIGLADPFVRLWHAHSHDVRRHAGYADHPGAGVDTLGAYVASVVAGSQAWTGWLLFQFTQEVATQFRSRVPDWQQRLSQASHELLDRTSSLSPRADSRLTRYRDSVLAPALDAHAATEVPHEALDEEYRAFATRNGLSLAQLVLAYGLDWYRRGYSYRSYGDVWVAFHPLRADAPLAGAAEVANVGGPSEVAWSSIVIAYLRAGRLAADQLLIADTLESLRDTVRSEESGFAGRMAAAEAAGDPARREHLRREAVVSALIRAGILPVPRRAAAARGELAGAAGEALASGVGLPGAGLLAPLLGTVVRVSTGSAAAIRISYRMRRLLRRRSLWRAFEVPGLTSG